MTNSNSKLEIFLPTLPGLEETLLTEIRLKGFKQPKVCVGGVTLQGGWDDVWRANLWVRGASSVFVRIASFHAEHFSEFESHAKLIPWRTILAKTASFTTEATCSKSRLYHTGAITERLTRLIEEATGNPSRDDGDISIKVRIDHDYCTISIDTSGEPLYKRGYKEAVTKAPLRETLASLLLYQCGYDGTEPVFDPMCGSGTFVIEAAEIAARLNPGRHRQFAFEKLENFNSTSWQKMQSVKSSRIPRYPCYGSDRDQGAIIRSQGNAARAGVSDFTNFSCAAISDAHPPTKDPGLIIFNPPYGSRLGDKKKLFSLYASLGMILKERFKGWRVGFVTSEAKLAYATGLPLLPTGAPIPNGGIRIKLYKTNPLA